MLHRFLGLLRVRKLNVSSAANNVRHPSVNRQLDILHSAVGGEDLNEVLLRHVTRQPANVDLRRLRRRRAFASSATLTIFLNGRGPLLRRGRLGPSR